MYKKGRATNHLIVVPKNMLLQPFYLLELNAKIEIENEQFNHQAVINCLSYQCNNGVSVLQKAGKFRFCFLQPISSSIVRFLVKL